MATGWIKLHRATLENPIVCKDPDHLAVWVYLLLNATHTNYDALFKGKRITLVPGQLIAGRKSISSQIKVSEFKVQRILKTFENAQQIAQQTSSQNRLISILNWERYQDSEQQNAQPLHNECTTTAQRVHTNNNIKNIKNIKKDIYSDSAEKIYNSYITNKKRYPDKTKKRIIELVKKYGEEQILRAVNRYVEQVKGTELKYIKESDGFFNEEYIYKYLDANYKGVNTDGQNGKVSDGYDLKIKTI